MEKYTVTKAFSVLEKALLIPEDEIYAEEALASRYRIFNAKTRKLIGLVSSEKFKKSVIISSSFKIYDNEKSINEVLGYILSIKLKTRSQKQKEDLNFIKNLIIEKF